MTKNMSKEEYMKYTEARKASFTYKKSKKVCKHYIDARETIYWAAYLFSSGNGSAQLLLRSSLMMTL